MKTVDFGDIVIPFTWGKLPERYMVVVAGVAGVLAVERAEAYCVPALEPVVKQAE